MKFVLLINPKLLTTVNSFLLNIAEHEILCSNKYENANCQHFMLAELSIKKFYNFGAKKPPKKVIAPHHGPTALNNTWIFPAIYHVHATWYP